MKRASTYRKYSPTDEDRIWLLRAVAGEGRDHREVAQALAQRFRFLRETRPGLYPTLASLVRAYSQPVNPRWLPGGDKFEAARAAGKSSASDAAVRRRRVHHARVDFDPQVVSAAGEALCMLRAGWPPNAIAPEVTHFAAPDKNRPHMIERTTARDGRNRLWTTQGSVRWAQKKKPCPGTMNS